MACDIKTGILTFHCADNYGAMLQAYGLKTYLRQIGLNADIVRYEPPFMTGRHWWIPYIPMFGLYGRLGLGWKGWMRNLHMGRSFFARRANMRRFRQKYLVEDQQRKLFFAGQMKSLAYQYYLVGSDQIWNPDITLGLRRVYFGVFENKCKKRVAAYAASIGGMDSLSGFRNRFSELVQQVDMISVREEGAVPYIKQFYMGNVDVVPDPVFLLDQKEWQKIEKLPDREGYVLIYITEENCSLVEYAKRLSREKRIPIIELRSGSGKADADIMTDYVAGPAEFLGYIHNADYVVTNSYHGVAFSIIFQKQFAVFAKGNSDIRITSVIQYYNLNHRLYHDKEDFEMDTCIDWNAVKQRREEGVRTAEEFIMRIYD